MLDELIVANRSYSEKFSLRGLPPKASKGLAILTCMDSRIEPLAMLGLVPGDAKILRNAGGRVTTDVLRSLVFATCFLGVTEIVVMQHTKCALGELNDDDVKSRLVSAGLEVGEFQFMTMDNPDQALECDIELVRSCASLPPGINVQGWRYDVDDGSVSRVIL
ncbi:MAG: carbonic anhydrase [Acidimicrobiaceae bacterium]|nr:carbonic anhydrase [Acidimicrobiaceae bacterium]